ncbi:PAS domain S-box protein [Rhodanobacter sp. AS-Z3]|uniref:sensor histidine kinase n=1 Tax=Rhodanobacter sp. AS-Z3 TaxID=3031330 RepID=UPI00247869D0|nr:PAS domain S-box protein [Rhodanobacter sp. AS-Z3]WEN14252.1 PAS domain S-box protein [Rhodanobacter sp. AS-Z3]
MRDTVAPVPRTAEQDLLQLLGRDEGNVVFLDAQLGVRRIGLITQRLLGFGLAAPPRCLNDIAQRLECPALLEAARQALETSETVLRNLHVPERQVHLALRFHPSRSDSGGVDGLMLSIADTTERWHASALARHLAAIVKYSDDAILSKDLNGIITSWNNGAQRLFGYTREETIGQPVTMLIPEGMPDEEPGILERIRRGEAIDHYPTTRMRKDGSLIDVSLSVSPVLDDDGNVIGASKIARDVTQEKLAQRQREALINELNHRVKNSLATVQSIAYQSLRYATSLDGFAETFSARLLALSKTQDLLTTGYWMHASLRDLVLNELAPYHNEANAVRLLGDDVQLQPRMVTALGMLIHELATNAVKHGALSVPGGHLTICWQTEMQEGLERLRLSWLESDGPPILEPPARKGMGSRLLETVVAGLGGSTDLQYAQTGLSCVIDVPLRKKGRRE